MRQAWAARCRADSYAPARRRDRPNHSGRLCYKSLSGAGPGSKPRGTLSIPSSGLRSASTAWRTLWCQPPVREHMLGVVSSETGGKQFGEVDVSEFILRAFSFKNGNEIRVRQKGGYYGERTWKTDEILMYRRRCTVACDPTVLYSLGEVPN